MNGRNFFKPCALALGLILSQPLWAAQYQITVDAQIQKTYNSPTIFGLSAASIPVHFTFVVDTSLAPIVTFPAGTNVSWGNSILPANTQLISRNSITSFNFVVGTGSWQPSDLLENSFETGQTFDVLLSGDLVDGSTPQIYLVAGNGSGGLQMGALTCFYNATCSFANSGSASSLNDHGSGAIVNIQTTVTLLNQTPAEKIADAISLLDTIPTLDSGTKNSLTASLGGALDKLDTAAGVDIVAAKGKLDAFINKVKAQSGKKLTTAEANELITLANDIKAQL